MSMDAQVLPPPREVGGWGFLVLTILFGCAGALIGLTVMGQGDYVMGPFFVTLKVKPSLESNSQMAIAPRIVGVSPGTAEANTHQGFLSVHATIIDLAQPPRPELAAARAKSPELLATSLREESSASLRKFAIRGGLGAAAGAAAGGALVALFGFRARRIFQGLLAGLVLVGLMGIVMYVTFDVHKFRGTTFKPSASSVLPAG